MLIDDENSKKGDIKLTDMVEDLKGTGMEVHPYTVRKDALPAYVDDIDQMFDVLLNETGATGLFTDFPDLGVNFVKNYKK
jgi:glycerophosphoryl diester phosphodiesterase